MPWKVVHEGDEFVVVVSEGPKKGKRVKAHASKAKAEAHVKALYANTNHEYSAIDDLESKVELGRESVLPYLRKIGDKIVKVKGYDREVARIKKLNDEEAESRRATMNRADRLMQRYRKSLDKRAKAATKDTYKANKSDPRYKQAMNQKAEGKRGPSSVEQGKKSYSITDNWHPDLSRKTDSMFRGKRDKTYKYDKQIVVGKPLPDPDTRPLDTFLRDPDERLAIAKRAFPNGPKSFSEAEDIKQFVSGHYDSDFDPEAVDRAVTDRLRIDKDDEDEAFRNEYYRREVDFRETREV